MNTKLMTVAVALMSFSSFLSFSSFAGENEEGRGRWTFSAGPSWRSRVKMETHGTLVAPAPTPPKTTKVRSPGTLVADPNAGKGGIPADGKLWGVSDTRTEVYGTAGANYSADDTDVERPLGLNLQGCYDLVRGETWSVGLNLRFAGYWNLKSSSRGYYNAGSTVTDVYRDDYIFPDLAPDGDFAPDPADNIVANGDPTRLSHNEDYRGSRAVSTRLRSDLYQIGFGPKVTWSPFVGWCDALTWIDVYGGVEVLCNLAHNEFRADGHSSSQTDCLIGFGGNVGIVGNLTENIGIYGQVGYEWIDKSDVSTGGFKADIDYSSLVVSAGIQVRF